MAKKYLIFVGAFTFWLVGDLWSKHWADVSLSDAYHPMVVRVGPGDAGKPLVDVLVAKTGVDQADVLTQVLPFTRKLGAALTFKPQDSAFRAGSPGAKYYSHYVFWRGLDEAPRRVDKVELVLIRRWLARALPDKTGQQVEDIMRAHLDEVTFSAWLSKRIPKVDEDDVPSLGEGHVFPVERRPVRPTAETQVSDGEVYLLEHRRIDVMGTWTADAGDSGREAAPWFQYLYAENPGAAFGFMNKVPEDTRQFLFFILTMVAFTVIIGITIKLPENVWWLALGLGSILAGAAGNFVDRQRYGYVIDFIDMHLGFMHWPTYNIADVAIAVGVGLLLGDMLFNKNSPLVKEPEPKDAESNGEESKDSKPKKGKKPKKGAKKSAATA